MSLVDLYKNLINFFSPQEVGRIIQKAVINKLNSFLLHGEKEVFIKHKNLLFPFKIDGLLYIEDKFVVIEIKTGKSTESLLQKVSKSIVDYCLIKIDEKGLNIYCNDEKIKKEIVNKLGGD